MDALERIGVTVLDKSVSGSMQSADLDEQGVPLPISTKIAGLLQKEDCVEYAMGIAAAFVEMRDLSRARAWLRATIWLDNICTGGGRALFDIRYKDTLDRLDLSDLALTKRPSR